MKFISNFLKKIINRNKFVLVYEYDARIGELFQPPLFFSSYDAYDDWLASGFIECRVDLFEGFKICYCVKKVFPKKV